MASPSRHANSFRKNSSGDSPVSCVPITDPTLGMYPVSVLDNRENPTGQLDVAAKKKLSINQTSKEKRDPPSFTWGGGGREGGSEEKVPPRQRG